MKQVFDGCDTLDSNRISYTIKKSVFPALSCESVAKHREVYLSQVVKCMVGENSGEEIFGMLIPGDRVLKIKKVRNLLGGVRVFLMSPEDLVYKLGLTVGAISPLQLLGKATLLMDKRIFDEEKVDISSGTPLAGIQLSPIDLLTATKAKVCDIISDARRLAPTLASAGSA